MTLKHLHKYGSHRLHFDGESHSNEKTKNLLLYFIDHNVKLYCQNQKVLLSKSYPTFIEDNT